MQGKMKSFFEDTGIILVLSAAIYGGYYGYTTFSSDSQSTLDTKEPLEKVIINEPSMKNDIPITIEKIVEQVIIEPIEKQELKEKEIKTEIQSPKIMKKPLPPIIEKKEKEVKKEKNVDLTILKTFLRNIKFSIASNIVKRDDINATVSQELKLRVTVLKDGSFEDLLFVDGDKQLFEMNKENILKVFPVYIDNKIKDEFPRYIRISIK